MADFFNSIKKGMNEAIQFTKGKCPQSVEHQFSAIDVNNILINVVVKEPQAVLNSG